MRDAISKSDSIGKVSKWSIKENPYAYSFDAYKAIWDDARATKAFERSQLPTSDIKAKYKDGTLTKQDVQDIIYAKKQDSQSQYIYQREKKWWVLDTRNDTILSLENMIADDIKPKNILSQSKDLQPLYDEAKKRKKTWK